MLTRPCTSVAWHKPLDPSHLGSVVLKSIGMEASSRNRTSTPHLPRLPPSASCPGSPLAWGRRAGCQLAVRHGVDRVTNCGAEEGPRSRGGADIACSRNAVPRWRRTCCELLLARRLIFASSSAASYTRRNSPLNTAEVTTCEEVPAPEEIAGGLLLRSRPSSLRGSQVVSITLLVSSLGVCATLTPCGSPSRARLRASHLLFPHCFGVCPWPPWQPLSPF